MQSQDSMYYVYEHLRADTGEVFYVGKGCKDRAETRSGRSEWWKRIDAKYGRTVRYLITGIDEELAHLIECERIAHLRESGVPICNITNGGDGVRMPFQKPEWNAKRSASLKGRVFSPEHTAKISTALKGRGHTDSHKESLRRSGLAQSEERARRLMGGNSPALRDDVRAKIAATMSGKARSEESRQKQSQTMRSNAHKNPSKRADVRERLSQAAKARVRPTGVCPHCQREMLVSHLKRWHYDKCNHRA